MSFCCALEWAAAFLPVLILAWTTEPTRERVQRFRRSGWPQQTNCSASEHLPLLGAEIAQICLTSTYSQVTIEESQVLTGLVMRWEGYWIYKDDPAYGCIRVWNYLPDRLVADTGFINWGASDTKETLFSKLVNEGTARITKFADLDQMRNHYKIKLQEGFTNLRRGEYEIKNSFMFNEYASEQEASDYVKLRPFSHLSDDNWDYNVVK
jgi:hypothetical protein